MKKKIFLTAGIFIAAFALVSVLKINAAGNVTGYLWGGTEGVDTNGAGIAPDNGVFDDGDETKLGWVSMSSPTNLYGITIPDTNTDVFGYAWSENYGYLDFNPQGHCGIAYAAASCSPPGGDNAGVKRSGNTLVGWARWVDIAKETVVPSNSGGADGWVRMSGTAQDGSSYGVIINADRSLGGYAWSDTAGYISFSRASIDIGPVIQFSSPTQIKLLNSSETFASIPNSRKEVTLSWNVTGASSCNAKCGSGDDCDTWDDVALKNPTSGSMSGITLKAVDTIFILECTSSTGIVKSAQVEIPVGCNDGVCSGNSCQPTGTFRAGTSYTCGGCTSDSQCTARSMDDYIEVR